MDAKNIVTLGIGAAPGGLVWFLTGGLEAGAAVVVYPLWTFTASADGRVIEASPGSRVITAPTGGRVIEEGV